MLTLPFNKNAQDAIAITKRYFTLGFGYFHEQATKPQTLGYGLTDSPIGLLAWIYEKLVAWSDSYPWSDDEGEFGSLMCNSSTLADTTHTSVGVGIDILVLTRRSSSVAPNILRDDVRKHARLTLQRDALGIHPYRNFVLSQGACAPSAVVSLVSSHTRKVAADI